MLQSLDRFGRILFYLALATLCYGVAFAAGRGVAFFVFLIGGGLIELAFWRELLFPKRQTTES